MPKPLPLPVEPIEKSIPPGHLGRCPTCEEKMIEYTVAMHTSEGVKYVTGWVCTSGKHDITRSRPKGYRFERTLINGS
jgi:hypothetical protein